MSKADILAKLVSAGAVLADGTITASELGLATVATSGSYTDLSGKPTLFSGSYTDLTNKPTTLAGYGITDAQPLDGDLTSIAALAGTSGLLKKTAANTWTLDTNTYLTGYTETDTLATVTARGATSSAQITLSGAGDNTTTYSSLRFAGYNQGGGVGYHGFFEVQNTYGSVINGKKFFRLDGSGSLQIINSAYTTNIFNLTDAGVLTVPQISAGGSVGTNGQVLTSTGTGLTWTSAGAGTVTSVSGTGTVSGLTLTGTVTASGSLTLGGTLAVTASNFTSQTANTVLAAPNGAAGVPTFRALVAADIPTLNQNTTGSAATLTTPRLINGVSFNGSADITVADSTKLPLTGGTISGSLTVSSDLTVTGNLTVNGTTTTVNSTTLTVDDKNIELGSVATPTDTTADGGGITLKGATDKTFNWVNATQYWTASHSLSAPQHVSTIATGTAPLVVASTTVVTNLNADTLDGNHASAFALAGHTHSYLSAESDTLATVTARDNTTTSNIQLNGSALALAVSTTAKVFKQALAPTNVTVNTATSIDTWATATYRSAKYTIQVTQGTKYQTSEVRVLHDGTNVFMNEYAVLETNAASPIPVTFSAAIATGTLTLSATITDAATTNASIVIDRTLIVV